MNAELLRQVSPRLVPTDRIYCGEVGNQAMRVSISGRGQEGTKEDRSSREHLG